MKPLITFLLLILFSGCVVEPMSDGERAVVSVIGALVSAISIVLLSLVLVVSIAGLKMVLRDKPWKKQ